MKQWTVVQDHEKAPIATVEELRERLVKLRSRDDPTLILEHQSGDGLFVTARGPYAGLSFRPVAWGKPSLAASTDPRFRANEETVSDWFEFSVGGTPTPVPKDRCIPFETAVEVVLHYFLHGSLPDNVSWVQE